MDESQSPEERHRELVSVLDAIARHLGGIRGALIDLLWLAVIVCGVVAYRYFTK